MLWYSDVNKVNLVFKNGDVIMLCTSKYILALQKRKCNKNPNMNRYYEYLGFLITITGNWLINWLIQDR